MPVVCHHYVIGVSVGVSSLPSAVAILEQETTYKADRFTVTGLHLRHLERPPASITYPELVTLIGERRDSLKEQDGAGAPEVIADTTGTGQSVAQLLRDAAMEPWTVTVTAGTESIQASWANWKVPKMELIGGMLVEMQTGRFKVAEGMELGDLFQKELRDYRPRLPNPDADDVAAWRERPQDDLVFASAVAVWWARNNTPSFPVPRDRWRQEPRMAHSWMVA